jgi:hypothetical protein
MPRHARAPRTEREREREREMYTRMDARMGALSETTVVEREREMYTRMDARMGALSETTVVISSAFFLCFTTDDICRLQCTCVTTTLTNLAQV